MRACARPAHALSLGPPTPLATALPLRNGSLAASGGSYVHVVYAVRASSQTARIMYRRSVDGGMSWMPAIELSRPGTERSKAGPTAFGIGARETVVLHGLPRSGSRPYRSMASTLRPWRDREAPLSCRTPASRTLEVGPSTSVAASTAERRGKPSGRSEARSVTTVNRHIWHLAAAFSMPPGNRRETPSPPSLSGAPSTPA